MWRVWGNDLLVIGEVHCSDSVRVHLGLDRDGAELWEGRWVGRRSTGGCRPVLQYFGSFDPALSCSGFFDPGDALNILDFGCGGFGVMIY